MLFTFILVQLSVFALFASLETAFPNNNHPRPRKFNLFWIALGGFALMWLKVTFLFWTDLPGLGVSISGVLWIEGCTFYLVYSFSNYWFHRFKHTNAWAWHYLHTFHHSPSHMEARIAFYRHPAEIMANFMLLVFLGKGVFNVSVEGVALALLIEGCLEVFHHSNIKLHNRLRPMGYLIQTPEMHLVHHQRGVHRYNYGPFIWDTVFGTVRFPDDDTKPLGFLDSDNVYRFLVYKNGGR